MSILFLVIDMIAMYIGIISGWISLYTPTYFDDVPFYMDGVIATLEVSL